MDFLSNLALGFSVALTPFNLLMAVCGVMLGILIQAKQQQKPVSALAAELPARFTASDRLKDFPIEKSREILARFSAVDESANRAGLELAFGGLAGPVESINRMDGLRVTFANDEIIHLRPSGTAPEFRCYTEAGSDARALELTLAALAILKQLAK